MTNTDKSNEAGTAAVSNQGGSGTKHDLDRAKLLYLMGKENVEPKELLEMFRTYREREDAMQDSRNRYNTIRKWYQLSEVKGEDRALVHSVTGYLKDHIFPNTFFLYDNWSLWHTRYVHNTLCNAIMESDLPQGRDDSYQTWRDICVVVRKCVRDTKNNFISKAKVKFLGTVFFVFFYSHVTRCCLQIVTLLEQNY